MIEIHWAGPGRIGERKPRGRPQVTAKAGLGLAALTTKHNIVVDVVEDAVVPADAAKVRQIISNLVSNAVKFSPSTAEQILGGLFD